MKKVLHFGVLLFLVSALAVPVTSFAQEDTEVEQRGGSGFRISPVREDLEIERGGSETRAMLVRNVTNTELEARAVVDDFGPSGDESGSPQLLVGDLAQENYPFSIKPFVASISDTVLAPGEERSIDVTYSIPEDAAPGSYYGVIRMVAAGVEGDPDSDAAVTLNASVGMIVLISVPGETLDLLELEEAAAIKDGSISSMFSSAPDSFMFRITNKGNTFQAPFGRVAVKNWSGDVVYEYELNETQPRGFVLPDSIRRFEDPLEGIGSFGRYTVEANISYGSGGSIITTSTTFWVVPWGTVLIVSVGAVALLFGATRGVKAYNKRVIEGSKGSRVKKK